MFHKAILALSIAATVAGGSLALSAPATAHSEEPPIPGHNGNHWHNWHHDWDHYGYWNHPHFEGSYYADNSCYFEIRTVRIDTPDGPVYEKRNLRICN